MTTGKTIALTSWTFVSKIMSLLFNMLSRFVIVFLPRSKCLLISWLQSPSAGILEPKKIKSVTVSIVSSSVCHDVIGPDAMILVFWMLNFKPTFSLSSFTFIKRLFSSSLLSAIGWCHLHIWGYWHFSCQSCIPAENFSKLVFIKTCFINLGDFFKVFLFDFVFNLVWKLIKVASSDKLNNWLKLVSCDTYKHLILCVHPLSLSTFVPSSLCLCTAIYMYIIFHNLYSLLGIFFNHIAFLRFGSLGVTRICVLEIYVSNCGRRENRCHREVK